MKENRYFNRTDFNTEGYLQFNNKKTEFEIVNISLKGILIHLKNKSILKYEDNVKIIIKLLPNKIEIIANAVFLHQEGNKYGFRFEEIDLESLIHLRRLLELNSIDPDEIVTEFAFLEKH